MVPVLSLLESSFLPLPDRRVLRDGRMERVSLSLAEKVQLCAANVFRGFAALLVLPAASLYSGARTFASYCVRPLPVLAPANKTLSLEQIVDAYPEVHGFSQSLFQDEGLGTYASPTQLEGESNWNRWLDASHIEGSNPDHRRFFIRILSNPKPFVELLKKMGANAHRFSFEWAVLEPQKGKIDLKALGLYKNFVKELNDAGIEPWGTLHHFVLPQWAEEAGSFASEEIRDHFTSHALRVMEQFPEVSHWLTFNEPGIYALQTRVRGVYPPGKTGQLTEAGAVLRNLMSAHCAIYAKAKQLYGDRVKIGISHQWLKFVPIAGNPLERLVCYFLSKLTHSCVYNFFKTGRFDFEFPFLANIHFEIPEEEFEANHRFLDFIAPQFYGFPRLKIGWNGGIAHPGYQTQNYTLLQKMGFTFGATCLPGGKMQAFGPSFDPDSLRDCLREAEKLGPIAITETGCDAMIQKFGQTGDGNFSLDEETQKSYFLRIAPILKEYKEKIKAIFIWTLLRGQLEWDRGDYPALGILPVQKDSQSNISAWTMTPSALLVRQIFQKKNSYLLRMRGTSPRSAQAIAM